MVPRTPPRGVACLDKTHQNDLTTSYRQDPTSNITARARERAHAQSHYSGFGVRRGDGLDGGGSELNT